MEKWEILDSYPLEWLQFRRMWFVTRLSQMVTVTALYAFTTVMFIRTFRLTGKMLGGLPEVWILFVPVTEEILFRGFILGALELAYGKVWAVVGSSLLFGLWHLKNGFWMSNSDLLQEILYTAFLFGPVMAVITLKTRSVWPAVILHYLNNIPAVWATQL